MLLYLSHTVKHQASKTMSPSYLARPVSELQYTNCSGKSKLKKIPQEEMIEENVKRKQILTCIVEATCLFIQHQEECGKF